MAVRITTYLTERVEAKKIAACLRKRLPAGSEVTVSAAGYVKVYAPNKHAVRLLRQALARAERLCKL